MARKPYSPVSSYADLKAVEDKLNNADTVDVIRQSVQKDGPKVGYKAFCYMLGGKMTAAAMKPDEACVAAMTLEQKGDVEGALAIYKQILTAHKEHPIASQKVAELG